jgi:AcrR family transcriptional regulator
MDQFRGESPSATVTPVTRRSGEPRLESLLRIACEVIAERGLANTRTADVASAAGVSQALLFYHFATKERLLARAFAYAAERDLARLDAAVRSGASSLRRLRRILRLYLPTDRSTSWTLWIDAWAESLRNPELERVSRRLDLRWKEALREVIADGVTDGSFKCDDPAGAAWRISAAIDGLAVQATVHRRMLPRRQLAEWVWLTVGRELGLDPEELA